MLTYSVKILQVVFDIPKIGLHTRLSEVEHQRPRENEFVAPKQIEKKWQRFDAKFGKISRVDIVKILPRFHFRSRRYKVLCIVGDIFEIL